jgi:hypothetical protein
MEKGEKFAREGEILFWNSQKVAMGDLNHFIM